MKIKIRNDALEFYIESNTDWNGEYYGEDRWELIMERIAGKIIEVDISALFKYEFNIKPILNVTKEVIRITEDYADEVINDIRIDKARCYFCNSTSNSTDICDECGRSDYLERFFDEE